MLYLACKAREYEREPEESVEVEAVQRNTTQQEGHKPRDVSVALIRKKHEVIGFAKVESRKCGREENLARKAV